MMCGNANYKKKVNIFWILVGMATIGIGAAMSFVLPEEERNLMRFAGMMTGFGAGVLGVGVVRTLRDKFSSAEKLKERTIEENDERNILILRSAYTVSACAAYILFAAMSFLFTFMGDFTATWIAMGAMYIDIIVLIIARIILQKKL